MKRHWALDLIGAPRKEMGRSPEEGFDCYGIVWWVFLHRYGIELAPYLIYPNKAEQSRLFEEAVSEDTWAETNTPTEGCVVALSRHARIHHIGVAIQVDGELKILHCDERVLAHTPAQLRRQGYRTIKFYQYDLAKQNAQPIPA